MDLLVGRRLLHIDKFLILNKICDIFRYKYKPLDGRVDIV